MTDACKSSGNLVPCPHCTAMVRIDRLSGHMRKVHRVSNTTPKYADGSSISHPSEQYLSMDQIADRQRSTDMRRCHRCGQHVPGAEMMEHIIVAHTNLLGVTKTSEDSTPEVRRTNSAHRCPDLKTSGSRPQVRGLKAEPPGKIDQEQRGKNEPKRPFRPIPIHYAEKAGIGTCRFCGQRAMPGDNVCYECSVS